MANGNVGTWRVGTNGRLTINGINLNIVECTIAVTIDDFDTTHYESTGIEGKMGPYPEATVTVKGNWDAGRNPYDNPPNLTPGQIVSSVSIYENVTDNVSWSFPYMRVISSNNGVPSRGLVTFEAQLKSNGTFTFPTGSV